MFLFLNLYLVLWLNTALGGRPHHEIKKFAKYQVLGSQSCLRLNLDYVLTFKHFAERKFFFFFLGVFNLIPRVVLDLHDRTEHYLLISKLNSVVIPQVISRSIV